MVGFRERLPVAKSRWCVEQAGCGPGHQAARYGLPAAWQVSGVAISLREGRNIAAVSFASNSGVIASARA